VAVGSAGGGIRKKENEGGNDVKKAKQEFKKGQRVTVRMGCKRLGYKWFEGEYLYKDGLYHYVKLDGNMGTVRIMNEIKEVTP
jgi:hypothetical protein